MEHQSLDCLCITNTKTNLSKMKSFIVFAVVFAVALAAPPGNPDADAEIIEYANDNIGVEGYGYSVKTSNGIQQSEQGQLKNVGTENEALSVSGSFSYTGNDGVVYSVSYVADEGGFKPSGAHIPQP